MNIESNSPNSQTKENQEEDRHPKMPPSADAEKPLASASSLRMRYQAEAAIIQKKLGNLEDIRAELGLSKRKMAQLLLVDPSAWTRWTRNSPDGAPPHIFRSLQWYMALIEKHPEWHPQNSFNRLMRADAARNLASTKRVDQLEGELAQLRRQLGQLKKKLIYLVIVSALLLSGVLALRF